MGNADACIHANFPLCAHPVSPVTALKTYMIISAREMYEKDTDMQFVISFSCVAPEDS